MDNTTKPTKPKLFATCKVCGREVRVNAAGLTVGSHNAPMTSKFCKGNFDRYVGVEKVTKLQNPKGTHYRYPPEGRGIRCNCSIGENHN